MCKMSTEALRPPRPLVDFSEKRAGSVMSGTAYAYVMCALVVLAIVVTSMTFDAGAWISRGLERGDLYALIDVASGLRPNGLTRAQAQRLQARGMVRPYGKENFRATLKGRLALHLRRSVRRTAQS